MILPERDEFLKEISFINKESTKENLILLYDNLKGINNGELDTYKILRRVLNDLFNPFGISQEPVIPFSFFETAIGKLVITLMNGANEVYYTTTDLVELSKTKDRPNGLTKQYLAQEIKDGRLKAIKDSGRWVISALEAERYLKTKMNKENE